MLRNKILPGNFADYDVTYSKTLLGKPTVFVRRKDGSDRTSYSLTGIPLVTFDDDTYINDLDDRRFISITSVVDDSPSQAPDAAAAYDRGWNDALAAVKLPARR